MQRIVLCLSQGGWGGLGVIPACEPELVHDAVLGILTDPAKHPCS